MDDTRLRVMVGGAEEEGGDGVLAREVARDWLEFLKPLLDKLERQIDLRLVRTMANAVTALVCHRNRPFALLLSELGAYLAEPKHAPTGTKRLGNPPHSKKWEATTIDEYLVE